MHGQGQRPPATVWLVTAALSTVIACGGGNGDESAAGPLTACRAVAGAVPADVDLLAMAGDYRLTLVRTEGDSAAATVDGVLSLHPHDAELRQISSATGRVNPRTTMPLYGTADIDLRSVGALVLGDLKSTDPMEPGVVVFEHRGRMGDSTVTGVTLTVGSLLNRRGRSLFDGGFTVLRVRWIEQGAFGGGWESGTAMQSADGYFCAFPASH